jgi:hypothetical protein
MPLTQIFKSKSFSYIVKGFWIAIGATGGLIVLGLGMTIVSFIATHSSKNIGAFNGLMVDSWDNITLNKEQKEFKSCYKRKEITHKGYWLWKGREKYIPYYISVLCEDEGFKVSGRFLKQYEKLEDDICKNLLGGIDC